MCKEERPQERSLCFVYAVKYWAVMPKKHKDITSNFGGFLKVVSPEIPPKFPPFFQLIPVLLRRLADIRRFRTASSKGRSAMTSATNKSTPAESCRKSCTDIWPTIPLHQAGVFFFNQNIPLNMCRVFKTN